MAVLVYLHEAWYAANTACPTAPAAICLTMVDIVAAVFLIAATMMRVAIPVLMFAAV